MDKIKSFTGYYGILLIMCGVIGIIVSFFNRSPNFSLLFVVVTSVLLGVGAGAGLVAVFGNVKLERLKQHGQAYPAAKATIVPIYLMGGDSSRRGTYHGFRVECEFHDGSGELRAVKSRALAVFKNETRMLMQDAPLPVQATIYVNPNKPKDYAIGIELLEES
ncbi:MAG: hypothetical protein LBE35_02980 [Clostridiales bacterium]|jgi:hypothetical protein|nr:hypothetical protein [Clostridiales bacterium]